MRCAITLACLLVLAAGCGGGAPGDEATASAQQGTQDVQDASTAAAREEPGPPDSSWLVGTWVLTHDPDNSPPDWLVFMAPDVALLRRDDGTEVTGTFSIRGGKVVVKLPMANGRTFSVSLDVAADRTRLVNASGAYYTRS